MTPNGSGVMRIFIILNLVRLIGMSLADLVDSVSTNGPDSTTLRSLLGEKSVEIFTH